MSAIGNCPQEADTQKAAAAKGKPTPTHNASKEESLNVAVLHRFHFSFPRIPRIFFAVANRKRKGDNFELIQTEFL